MINIERSKAIRVKDFDAKCSRVPGYDVCLCRLNCNYADEHNAPSICVMEDGTIIVLHTGHAADGGRTYALEQTIRRSPGEPGIKIWRPIVPIYAQDNMPLYRHEGLYGAHTGGWHCDMVAYVEYDD